MKRIEDAGLRIGEWSAVLNPQSSILNPVYADRT
jgi:hypothetical protein